MDIQKIIKENELFKGLSENFIGDVVPMCKEVSFKRGETIISKGDKEHELFLVPEGRVSLELNLSDGSDPILLNQAARNEVFGEMCLVNKHWRTANAVALDDMALLKISKDDLSSYLASNPENGYLVMINLAKILSNRLVTTNIHLLKASTPSISD